MFKFCVLFSCILHCNFVSADIAITSIRNLSKMAIGLSEISRGLQTSKTITILNFNNKRSSKINEFIQNIHQFNLQTCIFNDTEKFFNFVEFNLKGSLEVTCLIFSNPKDIIVEIHEKNLAHRLSLFIFFWGATELPVYKGWNLREPLRTVIITNPKKFVYRVYYNQACSCNDGNLKFVNWYDGNYLGLHKEPLLPDISQIYKNFNGRIFKIPVIHSPPWFFVKYLNASLKNESFTMENDNIDENVTEYNIVVSGRDDVMLKLLGKKMNFRFTYVEPPEKIQGQALPTDSIDNLTFNGGLGMLQRREAEMLFGDIVVTYEKMQEVEFSFFTLADSGAFLTHATRRLSEALALIYPFKWDVWPVLIFTVILTGPALYFIIVLPDLIWKNDEKMRYGILRSFHHITYIKEITRRPRRKQTSTDPDKTFNRIGLFNRCVWYSMHIYLRQSIELPHNNDRVRLFTIILWLSATYVLSDLYSAQLTSQLAKPSKELPINTLERLEYVLTHDKRYKLLVEPDSASYNVLKNGTGIARRLFKKMEQQGDNSSYLLNSLEEGVQDILYEEARVVFGGRSTLYFNMKRYGIRNFQLSEKLFTRYSAISLQKGCLFLDSLNENLMWLFEGGILEKITNDEYEKMFQQMKVDTEVDDIKTQQEQEEMKLGGGKSGNTKAKINSEQELGAINLGMLQGAFYVLCIGHLVAGIILIFEIEYHKPARKFMLSFKIYIMTLCKIFCTNAAKLFTTILELVVTRVS
ncbi:unnamed protein product [Diamesa serratosioi]